ncbi:MAG: primosomal protein N' [Bacteroidales bacterium]|nr:primosomal protein N' [Bacteroidales bacterium]
MQPLYAEVILPVPLPNLLIYIVPDYLAEQCCTGCRVVVPCGKSKLYSGVVYRFVEQKPEAYELKEVLEILDSKPVVTQEQIQFWQWIAEYYMCTVGEVYRAALPSGMKLESETMLYRTNLPIDYDHLKPKELILLNAFNDQVTQIPVSKVGKIVSSKTYISLVYNLIQSGYLVADNVIEDKYKPKTEKFLTLHEAFTKEIQFKELFDTLERKALKQMQVLMAFLAGSGIKMENGIITSHGEISRSKLLKNPDLSSQALSALVQKGVLTEYEKEVSRLEKYDGDIELYHNLTPAQQTAYEQIENEFAQKNTVLLYGVTGSGKTEIYIKLIDKYLSEGKRVLYLLPEIVLTSQIIRRLQKVFGNSVCIYHSKLSDAERSEIWKTLVDGNEPKLILGVRSSVFLPFVNLGLIIVDEEHETSFKQYDPAPRYNARDCSMVLAQIYNAKVLLGSATPSLESYFNAKSGKYGLVELNKRFSEQGQPQFQIVDTLDAMKRRQMKSLFSPQLLGEVKKCVDNQEQALLFRNRRGFSPYVECQTCGWIPVCENCDVSLTYHKRDGRLVCHHCGFCMEMPHKCMACGDTAMKTIGFGTEKIEDEIKIFFPDARISRLDSDVTTSVARYEKIISDFEEGNIDIIAGTQMISKGFDFKKLRLVAILNADSMLNYPDFRAEERAYQMISQVGGRAGRSDIKGHVLIQTNNPTHPVFQDIISNNYTLLYNRLIAERSKFLYPPYTRLVKIQLKHKSATDLDLESSRLADILRKSFGAGVLGPEYPIISRIQTLYIKEIMLKISRTHYGAAAKKIISEAIGYIKSTAAKPGLISSVNVDPL